MSRYWPIRREVQSINSGIVRDLQREVGATVQWREFDPSASTVDTLYDEAGILRWKPSKPIPVYAVIRDEGAEDPNAEGLYTIDTIHFSASIEQLRRAGLTKPHDGQAHLRDRIIWDDFVWDIRHYAITGRVQEYEVSVGIDAVKLSYEELVNDPDFSSFYT